MVWIDPSFQTHKIPEHERYEGTELDANIVKALPEDETIRWVSTYGGSSWAVSRKVDVVLPSGQEKSYFAKVYHAPRALDIAHGEFESTKRLREAIPHNVPLPVGYGLCADDASRSFFVAEFRDMRDELPGTTDLVEVVAKIHQKASPSGKFGFPRTTFQGMHAVDNAWCDSWEEWFTRAMRDTMAAELAVHGPDGELEELSGEVLSKVIPRLIRPLETGGRSIKPVLVHGDLWHGNISIDNETKRPVLYDPCCFYGHYAYDFSMWKAARYQTNSDHIRAYLQIAKPTEPTQPSEEEDDLHALRNDLATSICWPKNKQIRHLAMEEMKRLVGKYSGGYKEYISKKALGPRLTEGGEASKGSVESKP